MTRPPSSTAAIRYALNQDATLCFTAVLNSGTQINRRNYVRAVFALVDGFLSVMKQHALEEAEAGRFTPPPAERALLLEETYDLKEDGQPRVRKLFLPTLANVRFTFDVFARAHRVTAAPDYSGRGWQAFQDALKVRHRITHPKASGEIDLSDVDLENVREAHAWFIESTIAVYAEGRAQLEAQLQVARRQRAQDDAGAA